MSRISVESSYMVIPFGESRPQVNKEVIILPGVCLIGDVTLDRGVNVFPGVVIRADLAPVSVGARTNIQDGAVIHVAHDLPCRVGAGVTVGHKALLHGCVVEDGCLIGMGSIVLDGAVVGRESIIGAGAVVSPGTVIPPRSLVVGIPGKVKRQVSDLELEMLKGSSELYVGLAMELAKSQPELVPVEP